jgi:hypothetical protein
LAATTLNASSSPRNIKHTDVRNFIAQLTELNTLMSEHSKLLIKRAHQMYVEEMDIGHKCKFFFFFFGILINCFSDVTFRKGNLVTSLVKPMKN